MRRLISLKVNTSELLARVTLDTLTDRQTLNLILFTGFILLFSDLEENSSMDTW